MKMVQFENREIDLALAPSLCCNVRRFLHFERNPVALNQSYATAVNVSASDMAQERKIIGVAYRSFHSVSYLAQFDSPRSRQTSTVRSSFSPFLHCQPPESDVWGHRPARSTWALRRCRAKVVAWERLRREMFGRPLPPSGDEEAYS